MESDKDDLEGETSPRSAAPSVKRPHAVIDVEATEVEPSEFAMLEDRIEGEAAGQQDEAEKTALPDAGTDEPDARETDENGAAGSSESARSPSETPSRSPLIPGWASHLAAGLAGGAAAALLLFAALSSSLERLRASPGSDLAVMNNLERRLDTLEQAMPLPASPQLAENLAAAEDRLTKIEEAQSRLAGETKTNADRHNAEAGSRLEKLENQLTTLAASATTDASSGPIPQFAALTGKLADIEARTARTGEAAAALAADLSAIKSQIANTEGLIAAIKSENGQNGELARSAKGDAAALRQMVDALIVKIDKQLETAAKPADIALAVTPLGSKLASVERRLDDVAGSEESRRINAERILLTLELAGLKRAIERGESYARELAEVRATSAGKWNLAALEGSSGQGVGTLAALKNEFRRVEPAMSDAASEPADGSVFGRLVAGAKSIVRVRKIDHAADDVSVDAILSRMKRAIEAGRLDGVVAEAERLPPAARDAARDWLDRVKARHTVDDAIANLENQLRAALTNSGASSNPVSE